MKQAHATLAQERTYDLKDWIPKELRAFENPQTAIPAIAKDARLMSLIDNAVRSIPTPHRMLLRDARSLDELSPKERKGNIQLFGAKPSRAWHADRLAKEEEWLNRKVECPLSLSSFPPRTSGSSGSPISLAPAEPSREAQDWPVLWEYGIV